LPDSLLLGRQRFANAWLARLLGIILRNSGAGAGESSKIMHTSESMRAACVPHVCTGSARRRVIASNKSDLPRPNAPGNTIPLVLPGADWWKISCSLDAAHDLSTHQVSVPKQSVVEFGEL
jgi:hypothetical protein